MFKSSSASLEIYNNVSDEIKFVTNSKIRLKILKALYKNPQTMKEINQSTGLSYSSLSSNIHGLEVKDYVFREESRYFIKNLMNLYFSNIMDLDTVFSLCENYASIFNNHIISNIPLKSINNLILLKNSEFVQSDDLDIYKTQNIIKEFLLYSKEVKAIFPYSFSGLNEIINNLINKSVKLDLLFEDEIYLDILENINHNKNNYTFDVFKSKNNFLLILTDKNMALGFYKTDGTFDQNRLIIANDEDSLYWAKNLFNNFKKEKIK